MNPTHKLAVIIPVYNEGNDLALNFDAIFSQLKKDKLDPTYVLVDDGSVDNTWEIIEKIAHQYPNILAIRFARNFGKEAALLAGVSTIDAQYTVFMDSDCQHPPELVKDMLNTLQLDNANIIEGVKTHRGNESFFHRISAGIFYRFFRWATHIDFNQSSDFKIIDQQVVQAIRAFEERDVFFRGMIHWVGFKKITYPFNVAQRKKGMSRFSTKRLFRFAFNSTLSFSSKPLYIPFVFSLIFLFIALILSIQTLYNYFAHLAVSGFTTVIILILLSSSLILFFIGIIGMYIARIFDEVKKRPRHIISKRIGESLTHNIHHE